MLAYDNITTMQRSFIMHLASAEKRLEGKGDSVAWVIREFFKEAEGLPKWQSFHTRILNDLVLAGTFNENVGSNGTIFYSLSQTARAEAYQRLYFADKHVFPFVPATMSMFDLEGEN